MQRAEQVLAAAAASGATPLLAAATGLHAWLGGVGHGGGGARTAARAALVRFWTHHRLLRSPVPLTGRTAGDRWASKGPVAAAAARSRPAA